MSTTTERAEGESPSPGTDLVAVETTPDQIEPATGTPEPGRATYADVTATEAKRNPIIAEHWRRDKIRSTVCEHLGKIGYKALWQAVRVHMTVPIHLWYAFRGTLILIGRLIAWWHVPHLRALESQGVAQGGKEGHSRAMTAHDRGRKTRAARGRIIAVCAALAAGAIGAVMAYAPWWTLPLAGLISVPILARFGCCRRPLAAVGDVAVWRARCSPGTGGLVAWPAGSREDAEASVAAAQGRPGRRVRRGALRHRPARTPRPSAPI
jgi:hypothetical protein